MLVLISLIVVISYVLGSIPFGLVLTKLAGAGDIRQIGSGNIGATNVMRTGKKSLALLTLLLDAGKGAFAVWLVEQQTGGGLFILIAAVSVVIGHIYPIWLKGKGGKGVATALAVFAVLIWPLAVLACAVWLLTFIITKISSFSAILAMLAVIVSVWFTGNDYLSITISFIAGLVILRHHSNIARLLKGQENMFRKS